MTKQPTRRLRSNLEIINSGRRVNLKADPRPAMMTIKLAAESALRHHETLALSSWKNAYKVILAAAEEIEDIYDTAYEEARP